jgi:hypothetical protein
MLLVPPGLDHRTGPDRRTVVRGLFRGVLAPGIVLWLAPGLPGPPARETTEADGQLDTAIEGGSRT